MTTFICCNKTENPSNLLSPYYTFEDKIRRDLTPILKDQPGTFTEESFARKSYFTKSLMHLLVRTNLKQTCQRIWPDYSRILPLQFIPDSKWEHCLYRATRGTEPFEPRELTKEWADLVQEARAAQGTEAPDALKENKHLLMLFTIIFPHRATVSIVGRLGRDFNECWFIPPAIK